MHHANTHELIEDWRGLRAGQQIPDRANLSPESFRRVLPQLFILGREPEGDIFRLSGGLLVDLHGRELRDTPFLSLWRACDASAVSDALDSAFRNGAPMVLTARARSADGDEAAVEMVLAPLVGPTGEANRLFGLYQPISSLRRLGGAVVHELALDAAELIVEPRKRPNLRLVALDGRRLG